MPKEAAGRVAEVEAGAATTAKQLAEFEGESVGLRKPILQCKPYIFQTSARPTLPILAGGGRPRCGGGGGCGQDGKGAGGIQGGVRRAAQSGPHAAEDGGEEQSAGGAARRKGAK